MKRFIIGFAFLNCIMGCAKEFEIDSGQAKEYYVIDGRISNKKGPYYLRISKSLGPIPGEFADGANSDTATPVLNAFVTITDDNGVADTLIPATNFFEGMTYSYFDGKLDSAYKKSIEWNTTRERGFYQTTKLQGAPGHTYRLRVEADGQVFEASAYMPPVTELDSAGYKDTTIFPHENRGPIGVAYFKDPPGEKNYYVLKPVALEKHLYDNYFHNRHNNNGGVNAIDYYFFDDKLLVAERNTIPIQITYFDLAYNYTPFTADFYSIIPIRLCSITKETYDYIKAFSKQVINDGNVYRPAPASPRGNISNGALGHFFASHISEKWLMPPF
jgi:hypothetical protein